MLSKKMLKDFFIKSAISVKPIISQLLVGLPIFIVLRGFILVILNDKFIHISSLADLLINFRRDFGSLIAVFSFLLPLAFSFFSALFIGSFLLKLPGNLKNWPYFKSIAYRSILFALYLIFLYSFSIAIMFISIFLIFAYLNENTIFYQNGLIVFFYLALNLLIITTYPFTIFLLLYNGFLFNIDIEKRFHYFISLKKSLLFYFYNMPFFMVFSSILFLIFKILLYIKFGQYIKFGYIGYLGLDIILFTTMVVLTTNFYILRRQEI